MHHFIHRNIVCKILCEIFHHCRYIDNLMDWCIDWWVHWLTQWFKTVHIFLYRVRATVIIGIILYIFLHNWNKRLLSFTIGLASSPIYGIISPENPCCYNQLLTMMHSLLRVESIRLFMFFPKPILILLRVIPIYGRCL